MDVISGTIIPVVIAGLNPTFFPVYQLGKPCFFSYVCPTVGSRCGPKTFKVPQPSLNCDSITVCLNASSSVAVTKLIWETSPPQKSSS